MIITILLNLLFSLLNVVLLVLPIVTFPGPILVAFNYLVYQLNTFSFIFPVSTVFTILGYVLLMEFTLWSYHGLIFVYKRIRGS